ncbi:unnamed protein product [Rhizoctonia solani]|uniref:Uncharacterized protein n=1 Tax=Rhizoctonia solani TaxID=456999 RepID=A0A8H2XGI9_9AGAM|nr:unnamed protein product [Rhizoctonia solani]
MADVELAPSVVEQHEDPKDATLPLTPVSDGSGFKHGDHEDHLDAPNGTPVPSEPAHEAEPEQSPEVAEMNKPAENKPASKAPAAAASPMRPKAVVSAGARARTTSLATGKADPKAPVPAVRKTSATKPGQPAPAATSKRASLTPAVPTKTATAPTRAAVSSAAADARARRTSGTPAAGHASKPSISSTQARTASSRTPATDGAKPLAGRTTVTKPVTSARSSVTSPPSSGTATARATPPVRPRVSDAGAGPIKRVGSVKVPSVRSPTPARSTTDSPALKRDEVKQQLADKEAEISSLNEQVEKLREELAGLQSSIADLQKASDSALATEEHLNTELQSSKTALELAEADKGKVQSDLEETKRQLNETLANLDSREFEFNELTARVQEFESTITELRSTNEAAKLEIDQLKGQASTQEEDKAAAAIEHEALIKAREDLEAIRLEIQKLTASHQANAEQSQLRIKELESQLSAAEATVTQLRGQISSLESEKEELNHRISELDIEILELKEAIEVDADNHQKDINKLKDSHSKALADLESRFQEDLKTAATAHEEASKKWEEAIAAAGVEHSDSLNAAVKAAQEQAAESSKQALAVLEGSHAKVVDDLKAQFSQELAEAKEAHERSAALAAEELARLQSELAGQEDKYAAQVRQVKVEHDKLVEEAYHRAKGEADAQHSKELGELRARSDTAMEAYRNSRTEEFRHAEEAHRTALELATRPLESKINTLTTEANAARDDLAKAKGMISTQVAELKALKDQVSDLKQALGKAASAPPTTTPSAEIESLRHELRETKDDFSALKEVYQSMQENFAATVNNHKLELEEAAKGRVQALAALESKHEAEKARFADERATLLRKAEDEQEAKDRALAALNNSRSPPVTPRSSRIISNGTRDNLERLHHANDARLTQLETEHKQAIAQLTISLMEVRDEKERMTEELEQRIAELTNEKTQLAEELDRKTMELSFQEEELNDTQDEVKQLQDELERLKAHEQST